jgi:uncharacterized protein YndB with AHSA1/START domain
MNQRTVDITRIFDAPRERVFAAWTKAEHSPDGKDYRVRGNYREVVAPERLVIECTADDDKGIARLEEVITVTFTERAGKTTLTLRATASGPTAEAAAMLEGMQKGWAQTVDRLDAHLKP